MPSEKVLQKKQSIVADLTEKLKDSAAGVVVDYKGITVEDDTTLRRDLREAGVDYFVVKNSLLRFAVKDSPLEDLSEFFKGSTAIALSKEDPIAAAKIIVEKSEKLKKVFNVKAGFVDGKVIDVAEVSRYAKLPSRETLIAQVLGGLNSPIQSLAIVLKQIAEQKEEESA